jgi:flagellar hook protein FlgE
MSSVFSIALSSLQAESDAINITGNNLANMNTDGFKGSDVDFKDVFSESYGFGGFNTGLGVFAPVNNPLFTQGGVQTTAAPLAAAIQGNGFFVVTNQAGAQLYTRDGNFTQNAQGVLQTQTGENVQGWTASANGTIDTSGPTSSIILPTGTTLPPVATQNFSLSANLNAAAVAGASTGTFTAPMQVVDSLGNTHNLTVTFTQSATASNTWSYAVTVPVGDLDSSQTGTAAAVPSTVASGSLTFDTSGNLVNPNSPLAPTPVAVDLTGKGTNGALADGAANMTMNWNLFDSNGTGLFTNYAQTSGLASSTQDGTQAAQMSSVGIQTGGQIIAVYSNGQQKVAGQLALAAVQNPTSLLNVGDNNFAISTQTSTPAIGVPQSGGRGQIMGGSLESSNVDMAQQFTNLIVFQSAYQASSRVISTANTMTQDLMQLIH